MQKAKSKLTPEQLILRTIVISVVAHVLFLSFNWYQKGTKDNSKINLKISLLPDQTVFKAEPPVDIVTQQPITELAVENIEPESKIPEVTKQETIKPAESNVEVLSESINYATIKSSATTILTEDKIPVSTATNCPGAPGCRPQSQNHVQLSDDQFGFRAAMRSPISFNKEEDDGLFDEIEATTQAVNALSINNNSHIDQVMLDYEKIHLSEMQGRKKYMDCVGEKEASACAGMINIFTIIKLSKQVIEKVTEE